MLYHVPDISKALSEIRRVLVPGSYLYAATNGSTHMRELYDLVRKYVKDFKNDSQQRFSLENGRKQLEPFFEYIDLLKYHDSLVVNEPLPLIKYIRSMIGLDKVSQNHLKQIENYIYSSFDTDGEFYISKSGGLFKAN